MKKINIRPLLLSDEKEYRALHNLIWRDSYKHIFPQQVFDEREKNLWLKSFSDFVAKDPARINLVAEIDKKPIGFMSATLKSNYPHYKDKGFAEIMGLYIHPKYQGQGIGSMFKNLFLNWAKKNGATKFVIAVFKDNLKARNVYEKWNGKLDNYTQTFEKLGVEYEEVFYVFDL